MTNETDSQSTKSGIELFGHRLSWPVLITLVALLLSLGGLANQWILLSSFGVSLSDYADLDDFLVAAMNLLSWQAAGVFIGVLAISYLPKLRYFFTPGRRKGSRSYRDEEKLRFQVGFGAVASPIFVGAITPAFPIKAIKGEQACPVRVELKLPGPAFSREFPSDEKKGKVYLASEEATPSNGDEKSEQGESKLYLITGLNAAMFFYEKRGENSAVHAVPASAIAQVVYLKCPS